MAKKSPPQTSEAEEENKQARVTLDPDNSRKARVVAAALGISLPDYINNRIRPILDRELPAVLREMGLAVEKE